MSFPRYPKYKPSGVEWLGDVPEHWDVDRIKRSTRSCRNGIWGDEPQQNEDDIACVRVADFDRQRLRVELAEPTIRNVTTKERDGRLLRRNDLLLEKSGGGELQPVGFVVIYEDDRPAVCSNFVARVEIASEMCSSYWRYVHAAAYAVRLNTRSIKQTSGIQNLDQQQYFDERTAFPPLSEQSAIAGFLDQETSKIDGLVGEQRRLIELLKEKRQAVISHAVTKGLNPHAPLKPSGIQWLGDVPEHWDVKRIKHVATGFMYGTSEDCNSEDSGTPVLRIPNVKDGFIDLTDLKFAKFNPEDEKKYLVNDGEILVVRTNGNPDLVGKSALFRGEATCMFASYLIKISPKPCVRPEFLNLVMNAGCTREMLTLTARTSAGNYNMNCEGLGQTPVVLPPLEEQEAILKELSGILLKLDALTAEAERAIELLQERRTALISAAVTGKIDVRSLGIVDGAERDEIVLAL